MYKNVKSELPNLWIKCKLKKNWHSLVLLMPCNRRKFCKWGKNFYVVSNYFFLILRVKFIASAVTTYYCLVLILALNWLQHILANIKWSRNFKQKQQFNPAKHLSVTCRDVVDFHEKFLRNDSHRFCRARLFIFSSHTK